MAAATFVGFFLSRLFYIGIAGGFFIKNRDVVRRPTILDDVQLGERIAARASNWPFSGSPTIRSELAYTPFHGLRVIRTNERSALPISQGESAD
jgi:hypothetical protein